MKQLWNGDVIEKIEIRFGNIYNRFVFDPWYRSRVKI